MLARFLSRGPILALLLVGLAARAATASELAPGEVGLFFDPQGTVRSAFVPFGSSFDLYLVARVPAGGLSRYELVDVRFDAGAFITLAPAGLPPGGVYVAHQVADACSYASASGCPPTEGTIVPLVRYRLMRVGSQTRLCPLDFTCPSFAGTVAVEPTYRSCDAPSQGKVFELHDGGCIALDGSVDVRFQSWGTVKARFGGSSR